MIAYLKLDETSGSVFADYFNGHDASCQSGNCPGFGTGIVNGALDFNGTDQWITVPDHADLDWGKDDSFTIEVWAKLTNCDSRNKVMIGRDDKPSGEHWWLGCDKNSKTANFNLLDTAGNGVAVQGTTQINDNTWHHIVAVRDNSSDQNRLYIDGVLEDSEPYDYAAGFDSTTTLGIGYMAYTGIADYYYDGLLDEIALYSKALSDAEITDHYNGGAGKKYCETGESAPVITSTPVEQGTIGISYSYDVAASGYPAPTFSLTTSPSGMMIDANTGLITWSSPTLGDHDVTVTATNTAGTDTQSYTLSVAEAPSCPAGMISYWELDETTSGTYSDTYDSNIGQCSGAECPTPATGILNGGQLFSRSVGTKINVPSDTAFDWGMDDSFTIEYWMKGIPGDTCSGSTTNDNEVIVGRDDGGSGLHIWTGCAAYVDGVH